MSPSYPDSQYNRQSSRSSFHSLRDFAEKLPFLHPPPTPRGSRDFTRDSSRRTSIGLPTPSTSRDHEYTSKSGLNLRSRLGYGYNRGHRRQLSLSSFSPRGCFYLVVLVGILVFGFGAVTGWSVLPGTVDDGGVIPLGQSRIRDGREVFWWEQFERLNGYYHGRHEVVDVKDWVSEQDSARHIEALNAALGDGTDAETAAQSMNLRQMGEPKLVDVTAIQGFVPCYIDEKKGVFPPKLRALNGLPQGFPSPLLGSHEEIGLRGDVCYDRINRFGSYGYGFAEEEGGLDIKMNGDNKGRDNVQAIDLRDVQWGKAQEQCTTSKRYTGTRTAFIIRTWDTFEYTPFHIMMLRAMISELSLTSGGKYTLHFLIHVQNDSIPIWASDELYNQVLASSLPAEFAGMGTLWSVGQMKLIYPPPFADSLINFSGDDIYNAYRSLHFPLQYFAQKHPEFEYFWEWEMDIRVTGGYLELLETVTKWAEQQDKDHIWERSANFFIPGLFNNSYSAYGEAIKGEPLSTGTILVSGPQLPESERLLLPGINDKPAEDKTVDLITFSPLFDPNNTRWAFRDDMTGYARKDRPSTRAALITASRLSRRLLLTMHHETFEHKRTMFPEMFPASIALHYGYKAVYAPLPIYFDRDWPSEHANEVFNNAVIGNEGTQAGMDHGSGHFHGKGGSVFGPGEHVFRGASWYAIAGFPEYIWRRWLGRENGNDEIAWESDEARGRMCLPMMVLHPIKHE